MKILQGGPEFEVTPLAILDFAIKISDFLHNTLTQYIARSNLVNSLFFMILFRNYLADFLMNAAPASPDSIRNPNFVFVSKPKVMSSFHLYCCWWLLGFYDSTRDKDDTTVGVGHSRRYCNTGYDQSQGRRPSTLKSIGPISKGDIEPNHPSEIDLNSDSRSRSDGRSRRFVQYRVDQYKDCCCCQ